MFFFFEQTNFNFTSNENFTDKIADNLSACVESAENL